MYPGAWAMTKNDKGGFEDLILDRNLVYSTILFIFLFSIIMLVEPGIHGTIKRTLIGQVIDRALEQMREEFAGTGGVPPAQYFIFLAGRIYIQNLSVSAILSATAFTLIAPFIILSFNGLIVGYVLTEQLLNPAGPLSSVHSLAAVIMPHGAIEIPAIALVAGTSIKILDGLRAAFRYAIKALLLSAILLLIAALTEAFITPLIVYIIS